MRPRAKPDAAAKRERKTPAPHIPPAAERRLEEGLEESFPASDPLASNRVD